MNGCAYAFPAERVEDLRGASSEVLAEVEVDGMGFDLHFPAIDADLYVPALVAGIFGTRAWTTRELARIASRARSAVKAQAARVNGGGRGGWRVAGGGWRVDDWTCQVFPTPTPKK